MRNGSAAAAAIGGFSCDDDVSMEPGQTHKTKNIEVSQNITRYNGNPDGMLNNYKQVEGLEDGGSLHRAAYK